MGESNVSGCSALPALDVVMNKTVALILFLGGVVLLIDGIGSCNLSAIGMLNSPYGIATCREVRFVTGGAVACVVGLVMAIRGSKAA